MLYRVLSWCHVPLLCCVLSSCVQGLTYCSINQSGLVVTNVDTPVTMQVCVLVGMLITLRTLVYLSLRRRTSFKSA